MEEPDRRIPFGELLWRPAPFLGDEAREDRERTLTHLEGRRELSRPPLAAMAMGQEFRPGYLAKLRARILGLPPAEPMEFPRRVGRAVGER